MSNPISDDDLERVRATFNAGHPIQAIKMYREATGAGLAEAKRFVESLESGPQAGEAGAATASDEDAAAIEAAIFAGNKISAIKLHRAATGQGLKESKDFIDAVEAELRRTQPLRFTAPAAKGCGTAVLVLLGALGVLAGICCAIQ